MTVIVYVGLHEASLFSQVFFYFNTEQLKASESDRLAIGIIVVISNYLFTPSSQ